ncbi:MAG: aminotransferase class V-fold PLP-dependent enzyme [candidate division Zixibacteria bacterium]|nr:aminotransferase class V-fold PLP-dependent enzyme [candidate division Zixibacteria bacterium]
MGQTTTAKFRRIRKLFPVTGERKRITYLNTASTGPLALPVKKALYDYYEATQYLEKSAMDADAFAALDKIRVLGAGFIGAGPDEVGFGFSTTFGLNIAAFGLPLKNGDEVLLSNIEFPANVYPWLALKERGIRVKFIKSINRQFDIQQFRKSISRKSKVLSLSSVQFFNGYKNNLDEIGAICKENGLYFVVDGIQGCGAEPIDLHKSQIDIFSSGAQKWMLSPLGTSIFYIKKNLQAKLTTPFASWLSVDWKLDFTDMFHYELPFFKSAQRFEMGTYPYAHVFATLAAFKMINSLGIGNIQRHNHNLLDILIEYIQSNHHYRVTSCLKEEHRSSILAFTCVNAEEIYGKLRRSKIVTSYREGAIRVSPHLFNNADDIKRLIAVLNSF